MKAFGDLLVMVGLLLFTIAFGLAACVHAGDSTRTALNVLAEVIDPAYSFATDSCNASDTAVRAQIKAEVITFEAGEKRRNEIVARCAKLMDAFEQMRLKHKQALELVRAGHDKEAERIVAQLRDAWRSMKGGP